MDHFIWQPSCLSNNPLKQQPFKYYSATSGCHIFGSDFVGSFFLPNIYVIQAQFWKVIMVTAHSHFSLVLWYYIRKHVLWHVNVGILVPPSIFTISLFHHFCFLFFFLTSKCGPLHRYVFYPLDPFYLYYLTTAGPNTYNIYTHIERQPLPMLDLQLSRILTAFAAKCTSLLICMKHNISSI